MSNDKTVNIQLVLASPKGNAGVGAVKRQSQKVVCSKDNVVFNITRDTAYSKLTYKIQYQKEAVSEGDLSFSEDNKSSFDINVGKRRDTVIIVSFSVDGNEVIQYTLNIDPPALTISKIEFVDPVSKSSEVTVYTDQTVNLKVYLTREVRDGDNAKLQYKSYRKEPGESTWKEFLTKSYDLKKRDTCATVSIQPPANHSGTKIAISFFFGKPYEPEEKGSKNTVCFYEIQHRNGPEIIDVYWANKENIEFNDASTSNVASSGQVRSSIKNDEDAFLHIRTHQYYGRSVTVSLYERDTMNWPSSKHLLVAFQKVQIMDNVACVAFSMKDVCRVLKNRRSWENGNYELFCKVNYPANGQAKEWEMQHDLIVDLENAAGDKATKSTLSGTQKFVVGKAGEGSTEEKKDCGGKYCITKGNYKQKNAGKLIQEINIRLAGFGGNIPTEEFTDRTEACIKQFQRDYMGVAETGKVCGSLLKAIDDFEKKYIINFDDIKCSCQKCNGFGTGKYHEEYNTGHFSERERRYEYPGIHRSLIWGLRGVMFYTENKEKSMGFSVNCISSGYRCWNDNKLHRRSSTNHMGKALDIHFNKKKERTQNVDDIELIRKCIFNKYLGAQWDWKRKDIFNMESTKMGATTWVHFDVREYSLKYLDKSFFASSIEQVNGESIVRIAEKQKLVDMCNCIGAIKADQVSLQIHRENVDFTEKDAESALKYIYDIYGKEMAIIIERMYRLETNHFKSSQYMKCGTGGMEAHGEAPYYGWDKSFFDSHPGYKPVGLYDAYEGKGLSGQGGNTQVTDRQKRFVILPSVEAGMVYKAEYIIRHNGNYARWYSTDTKAQQEYKNIVLKIRAKIVDLF